MRQSARMLGWSVNLIGVVALVFFSSVGYSLVDTLMFNQGIGFGELGIEIVETYIQLSIPLTVNNTGRFPISNVILTTNISDYSGARIAGNRTFMADVPENNIKKETHVLRISLADLISEKVPHLLFQDNQLRADMAVKFTYGNLISLRLKLPNVSIPWGAPLHEFQMDELQISPFNATHYEVDVPLSFENHAPINIVAIQVSLLNYVGEDLVSKTMTVDIPPKGSFSESLQMLLERRELGLREGVHAQLTFRTPEFSFGPVEMPHG